MFDLFDYRDNFILVMIRLCYLIFILIPSDSPEIAFTQIVFGVCLFLFEFFMLIDSLGNSTKRTVGYSYSEKVITLLSILAVITSWVFKTHIILMLSIFFTIQNIFYIKPIINLLLVFNYFGIFKAISINSNRPWGISVVDNINLFITNNPKKIINKLKNSNQFLLDVEYFKSNIKGNKDIYKTDFAITLSRNLLEEFDLLDLKHSYRKESILYSKKFIVFVYNILLEKSIKPIKISYKKIMKNKLKNIKSKTIKFINSSEKKEIEKKLKAEYISNKLEKDYNNFKKDFV